MESDIDLLIRSSLLIASWTLMKSPGSIQAICIEVKIIFWSVAFGQCGLVLDFAARMALTKNLETELSGRYHLIEI